LVWLLVACAATGRAAPHEPLSPCFPPGLPMGGGRGGGAQILGASLLSLPATRPSSGSASISSPTQPDSSH
jgi:hypothetical protein